jgi:hypothetical protein
MLAIKLKDEDITGINEIQSRNYGDYLDDVDDKFNELPSQLKIISFSKNNTLVDTLIKK